MGDSSFDLDETEPLSEEEALAAEEQSSSERLRAGWAIATIGCASLFSWNAVITASGYYRKRFCGSPLHRSFESVFSMTYQITSLCGTLYATRQTEELAARDRIIPRLKALAVLFGGFAALACVRVPRDWLFVPLTLAGVAACGGLSQALSASLYGVAAALPPPFVSWNMAGQAVGGLIPAVIVVLSNLAEPLRSSHDDDNCDDASIDLDAFGYFAAAAALFGIAVVAFAVLEKTALYRHYVAEPANRRLKRRTVSESEPFVDPSPSGTTDFVALLSLARDVAFPAATVFLVFALTLSTFPTLTALARPRGHADDDDGGGDRFRRLFVPLLFLEFNIADLVGRSLAFCCRPLTFRPKLLLFFATARVGFLPLIFFGELAGSRRNHLPTTAPLRHSAAPFAVMLPYAASNGLLATLAMGAGAPLVDRNKRELVGNILGLFLALGLASGSALSFALLVLI